METDIKTFRIRQDVSEKLNALMQMEKDQSARLNVKSRTRSEIINDAIESYYLAKTVDQNSDLFIKIQIAIADVFRRYMSVFVDSLNATRFDEKQILEYQRLLCKAMNFDNTKDGLEILLYMTMPWDIAVPEKVRRELNMKESPDEKCDNK